MCACRFLVLHIYQGRLSNLERIIEVNVPWKPGRDDGSEVCNFWELENRGESEIKTNENYNDKNIEKLVDSEAGKENWEGKGEKHTEREYRRGIMHRPSLYFFQTLYSIHIFTHVPIFFILVHVQHFSPSLHFSVVLFLHLFHFQSPIFFLATSPFSLFPLPPLCYAVLSFPTLTLFVSLSLSHSLVSPLPISAPWTKWSQGNEKLQGATWREKGGDTLGPRWRVGRGGETGL